MSRFLFSSSCSNYGAAGGALLDETSPLRPVTAYGESKVRVEPIWQGSPDQTSSSFRCATRPPTAYRLGSACDVVVNNLTAWAFTTGSVRLKSDGTPWRPLIHIRDIAQAFLLLLDAPPDDVNGKAFNVGATDAEPPDPRRGPHRRRSRAGLRGRAGPDASPDTRNYRVDCDLLARTVGFRPSGTSSVARPSCTRRSARSASRWPMSRARATSGLRRFAGWSMRARSDPTSASPFRSADHGRRSGRCSDPPQRPRRHAGLLQPLRSWSP